jgi:uncharacterized protein YggE
METKPDTIKISASHQEEILSSQADLFVTVRGASVVGGDQAMKKAKEVSQLIEELVRRGLPEDKVFLQGMHFETSSGTLLKSSSAIYRLRLRCDKLDQIPALLDVIGSQKNAALDRIDWKYPEEEGRERSLEAALEKAKVRAQKVAASLGVRMLGVYDLIESSYDEQPPMPFMARAAMMKTDVAPAAPSLDMDIQHSKTIHVSVEIWYRVSEFEQT